MNLAPGNLLLAAPKITDAHFEESAILLCVHDENGSLGLVLNRDLELDMTAMLGDNSPAEAPPLSWGGPVAIEQVLSLHAGPTNLPDSTPVLPGICLGGGLDDLLELHKNNVAVRLFLGYSGWDPGQLEQEIAAGAWLLTTTSMETVFREPAATLWARTVAEIEPSLSWLRNHPQDPHLN